MTSSNGNIFRVTGHLCVEFTDHRWIPHTHKGQWRGALMLSLICTWINGWVNNGEAGDLRRHRAHYDVIVMDLNSHNVLNHFYVKPARLRHFDAMVIYSLFYIKTLKHIARDTFINMNPL